MHTSDIFKNRCSVIVSLKAEVSDYGTLNPSHDSCVTIVNNHLCLDDLLKSAMIFIKRINPVPFVISRIPGSRRMYTFVDVRYPKIRNYFESVWDVIDMIHTKMDITS